ncbi:MAG: hypothetical protein J2P25_16080 [Nocardiopsaceae bacterium]|nr:hypothetical protein [Nocardiopsaceae bacterium]
MTFTELYFHSSKRKFFRDMAVVFAVGFGFAVVGWAILTFIPITPGDAGDKLRGAAELAEIIGAAIIVFFALIGYPVLARTTRRRWGQFYPPAVSLRPDGAWFLPERGPVRVPWEAIERVTVRRTIYNNSTSTEVMLRLVTGAPLPSGGPPRSNSDRILKIGSLSDLSVPEDDALWFLKQAVGDRLVITDIDRVRER